MVQGIGTDGIMPEKPEFEAGDGLLDSAKEALGGLKDSLVELLPEQERTAEEVLDDFKETGSKYVNKENAMKMLTAGLVVGGSALALHTFGKWAWSKFTSAPNDGPSRPILKTLAGLTIAGIGYKGPEKLWEDLKKVGYGTSLDDVKGAVEDLGNGDVVSAYDRLRKSQNPDVNQFMDEHPTVSKKVILSLEDENCDEFLEKGDGMWMSMKAFANRHLDGFFGGEAEDADDGFLAITDKDNWLTWAAEEKAFAGILKGEVEKYGVGTEGTVADVIVRIQNEKKGQKRKAEVLSVKEDEPASLE